MRWLLLALVLMTEQGLARAQAGLAILEHVVEGDYPIPESFESHFELMGRWDFDPEVLVAEFNGIRVSPQGAILGLDTGAAIGQLFSADGFLIRELDPTDCEPGFDGTLLKATFFGDGSFLAFSDGGRPAFWFSPEGECLRRYEYGGYLPLHVLAGDAHELYTVHALPTGMTVDRHREDSVAVESWHFEPAFPSLNSAIPGGRLHRLGDGSLLLGLTHTARYQRTRTDGSCCDWIGSDPGYFRAVNVDPDKGTVFQVYMQRISRQNSIRVRSYRLDPDHLLSVIDNGWEPKGSDRRRGLQVIDADGNSISTESMLYSDDFELIGATDGLIFRRMIGANNPYLLVYRFKG